MHAPDPETASVRSKIAITLFVFCCLLSTARIIVEAPTPTNIAPDDISKRSDQRFAVLKSRLPAYGVIGYVGDSGEAATPDYYLTQYALAPVVVDRSANHAIVVGNFPHSRPSEFPPKLHLVVELENGVFLFANKDAH